MGTAQLILALLTQLPTLVPQIEALYTAAKDTLSSDDKATVEKALADAKAGDAARTAEADAALDAASNA